MSNKVKMRNKFIFSINPKKYVYLYKEKISDRIVLLNNGEIVGNPTPEEKAHLEKSFNIADMIIQGNYFKNN